MPPEGLAIYDFDGVPGAVSAPGRIHAGLGTLAPGATATLFVRLRPTFAGMHSLAATVASGLVDPDPDDNVTEVSVAVREGLTLRVQLVGTTIELSWPASEATAVLENSSTIQSAVWVVVGAAVEVAEGRRVVRIAVPSGARFYRLRVP